MSAGEEFRDGARRGLPADVVRRLNELDAGKAWLCVAETVAVLAACIALSLAFWSPWTVVPALLVIATRQQALFVLAHDAAHYRLFPQRWLNDAVGGLLGALAGISMRTYRVVHRLHHNHLYEPQDPDIPLHGGYPRGRGYLVRKLAKDLLGGTAFKTYAYFFGAPALNASTGERNRPLDDTSPRLRAEARRDRWCVAALHVAMPAAAFAGGYGVEYVVLWALPLATLLQPLLRFRAICEHGAVTGLGSPLTAARTNLGPRWLVWLLFPHNVNFHTAHHLYPAVPMYNLPDAHRELERHGLLAGAEVRDVRGTARLVFAEAATTPRTA
jgi:fatty acid desaturase